MHEFVTQSLRHSPFFSRLPAADIEAIAPRARMQFYRKKDHIYHRGDRAVRLFLIKRGWVRLYRTMHDGTEKIADVIGQDELFGERAVLETKGQHNCSAQAIDDTSILCIDGAMLRSGIRDSGPILRAISENLLNKMTRFQNEKDLIAMSGPRRVAYLLLRLTAHLPGPGAILEMPYEKNIAAAQMDMKPETFSRSLAQLKSIGVHSRGSKIRIESFARLSAFTDRGHEADAACHDALTAFERCCAVA